MSRWWTRRSLNEVSGGQRSRRLPGHLRAGVHFKLDEVCDVLAWPLWPADFVFDAALTHRSNAEAQERC